MMDVDANFEQQKTSRRLSSCLKQSPSRQALDSIENTQELDDPCKRRRRVSFSRNLQEILEFTRDCDLSDEQFQDSRQTQACSQPAGLEQLLYSAPQHILTHQIDSEYVANSENRHSVDYFNDDMEMTCVTSQRPVSGFSKESELLVIGRATNMQPIHSPLKSDFKALEPKLSDSELELTCCMYNVEDNGMEEMSSLHVSQSDSEPYRVFEDNMLQNEERHYNDATLEAPVHDFCCTSPPEFLELQQQQFIYEPETGSNSMSLEDVTHFSSVTPDGKPETEQTSMSLEDIARIHVSPTTPDRNPETEQTAMSLEDVTDSSSAKPATEQTVLNLEDITYISPATSHGKPATEQTSMCLEDITHISPTTPDRKPETEESAMSLEDVTDILSATPHGKPATEQTSMCLEDITHISPTTPDRKPETEESAMSLEDVTDILSATPHGKPATEQTALSLEDITHMSPATSHGKPATEHTFMSLEDVTHISSATPDRNPETATSLGDVTHISIVTPDRNPETAMSLEDVTHISLVTPDRNQETDQTAMSLKGITHISPATPDRKSETDQPAISLENISHIAHATPDGKETINPCIAGVDTMKQDIAVTMNDCMLDENNRLVDNESVMLADLVFEVEHSEQCVEQLLNGQAVEHKEETLMSENIETDSNQHINMEGRMDIEESRKLSVENEVDRDAENNSLDITAGMPSYQPEGEESIQEEGSKEEKQGENVCKEENVKLEDSDYKETEEQNMTFGRLEEDTESVEEQQSTSSLVNQSDDTCMSSSSLEEEEPHDDAYKLMQYVKEHLAESQLVFPWKLKLGSCDVNRLVFCYPRLEMTVQLAGAVMDGDVSSRQITSTEVQVISDHPNCFTQFVYGLLNIPTIIEDFSTLEHITELMNSVGSMIKQAETVGHVLWNMSMKHIVRPLPARSSLLMEWYGFDPPYGCSAMFVLNFQKSLLNIQVTNKHIRMGPLIDEDVTAKADDVVRQIYEVAQTASLAL